MRIFFTLIVPVFLSAAFGETNLPAPSGTFPVGRQMLLWNDPTRPEDVGPTAGKPREVAVYIFYPAVATGDHVEYYPGLAGLENAAETRILRLQFGGAWNAVTSGAIRTNAYAAPPMPPGRARFPVLVFSPGGQAPVLAYQLQLEELASHGYVVLGLEHGTDAALIIRPDRTMLPYVSRRPPDPLPTVGYLDAVRDEAIRRTADVVFSVNQVSLLAKQAGSVFHNRLDLSRIGVFGHSAGGQAAVRTCQIDARVRACLNQDGEMFGIALGATEPIPTVLPGKPTLAPVADIYVAEPLATDAQLAAAKVTRKQFEDWRAAKNSALRTFLQQNMREGYLITVTVPGYVHATFMDIRLLTANPDPQAALNHRSGTDLTRAFFDAQLRWGEQKNWSRFVRAPGEGITVEKLGIGP
ncbi:MAG: hypothetical protein ABSC23_09190 [Bryobacteraceae bacterium]|jgi:hypothetical protein